MKTFISKQKNCIISLIGLVAVCETLLNINNKIIQSLGIFTLPAIIMVGYILIRNEQKEER